MSRLSPVQRSLGWLREQGYDPERIAKVERYNHHTRRRHDAWNLFDYLVIDPPNGLLGVQCCGADFSQHVAKMQDNPLLALWLQDNTALLVGWRKVVYKRGSSRMVYRPRMKWWRSPEDLP